MVRRSRELTPAQTRGIAAKKVKISTTMGPHLAGRPLERLNRSRSCTPSDEEMEVDEDMDMTSTPGESVTVLSASTPRSGRFSSSAAEFSPTAFSPPVTIGRPFRLPAIEHIGSRRQESHDWAMRSVDEHSGRDSSISTSVLQEESSRHLYSHPSSEPDQTVTQPSSSTGVNLPATNATMAITRHFSESGFRPLAIRPHGYCPEPTEQEPNEQLARTIDGKLKGVKKAYQSQEERDKVKAVRLAGACLRCQIMRQACQVTQPGEWCEKCKVTRRKFSIACTRVGPAERSKYLFPEIVMNRHHYSNHKVLHGQEIPNQFRITLTHGSSFTLNLIVVEDASIPESELINTFFRHQGEGSNITQQLLQARCPPLVPVITTNFKDVAEWLSEQVVRNQGPLFKSLHFKVFPEAKGQAWPRSVLLLFQEFHKDVYQSARIFKVFRTLIVRHLMSRNFYIPMDEMRKVNAQMSEKHRESEHQLRMREAEQEAIVPKHVNHYLKSALMFLLQMSLKKDFAELEAMFKLHEKSPGQEITELDRDEALCYIAIILILVAIMQVKIMQVAKSEDHKASYKCPLGEQTLEVDRTKQVLQTIETEVIDHILGLWVYKFVKSNRKGPTRPEHAVAAERARLFNLVDRFRETQRDHDAILSKYTDLRLNLDDGGSIARFLIDNPTRVLLRFAESLTPSKSRKSQPR